MRFRHNRIRAHGDVCAAGRTKHGVHICCSTPTGKPLYPNATQRVAALSQFGGKTFRRNCFRRIPLENMNGAAPRVPCFAKCTGQRTLQRVTILPDAFHDHFDQLPSKYLQLNYVGNRGPYDFGAPFATPISSPPASSTAEQPRLRAFII